MSEQPIRLTQYSHGAGCGCKIAPAVLENILRTDLAPLVEPRLLIGYGSRDDAAVFDLGDGRALVSTTDFFSPIVDDAFDFGRIAATNALSDVYAMGGSPLMAVAILGWPVEKLSPELAQRVLDGGRQACHDAGIPLAGGHSIDAPEPFFGLAVTGEVPTAHIKRNDTAKEGDILYLTKPIGVGILSTAQKRGKLRSEHAHIARDLMCMSNAIGAELGAEPGVTAMTDITGFGLAGHILEVCQGSGLQAHLVFRDIPVVPEARIYISEGCYPDGAFRNWKSYGERISGAAEMERMLLMSDPQTSGGLLICVRPEAEQKMVGKITARGIQAWRIGVLSKPTNGQELTLE